MKNEWTHVYGRLEYTQRIHFKCYHTHTWAWWFWLESYYIFLSWLVMVVRYNPPRSGLDKTFLHMLFLSLRPSASVWSIFDTEVFGSPVYCGVSCVRWTDCNVRWDLNVLPYFTLHLIPTQTTCSQASESLYQ